ncbi:MAG: DUF4299 family protein [Oscillospiraceae bacterium]|nr:DUF4299 family protein [Oscillospiraceae bacterium]
MAVKVNIRGKGLFRKTPKFEEIIFPGMSYGTTDEFFRLQRGKISEWTVVFSLSKIGRGYEVRIGKGEIDLSMPLPTTDADILFFYSYIKKLCELMKTDVFYRDGVRTTFDKIDDCIVRDAKTSEKALSEWRQKIQEGDGPFYIFGAQNPVCMGKRELEVIRGNSKIFEDVLDLLQKKDCFYGAPRLYQLKDSDGIVGVYSLTEDVPTVLPYEPAILMNDSVKVSEWSVGFICDLGNGPVMAGQIPYRDFVDAVNKDDVYDSEHFVARLSADRMKRMLEGKNEGH